ncbi:hypothetical protein AB6A40_000698 [Gnathostoma spinigerum]|uniref:Uncharacterized protein n=1 Tax=Gnathostoma spinigerum TaxID=75299 RepID=A0ABD6E748_9BILA
MNTDHRVCPMAPISYYAVQLTQPSSKGSSSLATVVFPRYIRVHIWLPTLIGTPLRMEMTSELWQDRCVTICAHPVHLQSRCSENVRPTSRISH